MKKLLVLFLGLISLTACEEVVDIELDNGEPRLVIEASLDWNEEGTSLSRVKLSITSPFYNNDVTPVENAQVSFIDELGTVYVFDHTENGEYNNAFSINPDLGYTLEVIYENETYSATERINRVVPLEFVEQDNEGGFSGEEIDLKVFFTDPANEENFYYFRGVSDKGVVRDTFFDEFFNGNSIFAYYSVEDLAPDDEVYFRLFGSDQQYYSYIFTLLQQNADQGGGPFQTQPATVRGNIVNSTNPDNYPLGYFRVSEYSDLSYTVQ